MLVRPALAAILAPVALAQTVIPMALWWQKPENFATQHRVGVPSDQVYNGVLLSTRPNPIGPNDGFYASWVFQNYGGGNIELQTTEGRRMCLDAGLDTRDGTRAKLWQCYDGAPQQTFTFESGKIRLANSNFCLDLVDGNPWAGLQFWTCYEGNSNQYWNIYGKGPPYRRDLPFWKRRGPPFWKRRMDLEE